MIRDTIKDHNEKEKASFHMPGHKGQPFFDDSNLQASFFTMDTTELCDTDALIHPTGAILEAEQEAARLYGARHSFYLVNGSTCGILAMFYACFSPGETVLVDRACHQSVLHALSLCGLIPVYMMPRISPVYGGGETITAEQVERMLKSHPEAKGVFLTSPNYYGGVADLAGISQIVHEQGGLLLVDEAHGAHFPFSGLLPKTAMEQGADMSVVSLHKSMPAPNQTALLHMGAALSTEQVRSAVRVFQTSSPSYPFLMMMEEALAYGNKQGEEKTRWLLEQTEGIGYQPDDPFKRILLYQDKGYSGYEVERILRERFGIYAEMCDERLVLLMSAWCNRSSDFALLRQAVMYLDNLPEKADRKKDLLLSFPEGEIAIEPAALRRCVKERISVACAVGRVAAETVSAFPPCIPLILPGERITEAHVEALKSLQAQNSVITGMDDATGTIAVVL